MRIQADDEAAPAVVRLPEVLDADAASRLAGDLRALADRAVTLEASGVQRMGAQGLQVLLAARKSWGEAGLGLDLHAASPAVEEALLLFGVSWAGTTMEGWDRDVA
jgi:chemotaxis protein CheX